MKKAKEFFQSVRKAVKWKQSHGDELTSNKAKWAPVAAASDSKLEESLSISQKAPVRSKSYTTVIQSKDEEELAEIIEIPTPTSSNTSTKANESESEIKCPEEDSEAEMS
jgi:hypothetical protein